MSSRCSIGVVGVHVFSARKETWRDILRYLETDHIFGNGKNYIGELTIE